MSSWLNRNAGHRQSAAFELMSGRPDSNRRSPDPQSGALTKLGHVPPPPGKPGRRTNLSAPAALSGNENPLPAQALALAAPKEAVSDRGYHRATKSSALAAGTQPRTPRVPPRGEGRPIGLERDTDGTTPEDALVRPARCPSASGAQSRPAGSPAGRPAGNPAAAKAARSRLRRYLKRAAITLARSSPCSPSPPASCCSSPRRPARPPACARQAAAHGIAYPGPTVPGNFARPLVATEDHRFYSEPGIDPFAVGRVIEGKLTGGQDQGGATIEQQLAKLLYTHAESSLCAELSRSPSPSS